MIKSFQSTTFQRYDSSACGSKCSSDTSISAPLKVQLLLYKQAKKSSKIPINAPLKGATVSGAQIDVRDMKQPFESQICELEY